MWLKFANNFVLLIDINIHPRYIYVGTSNVQRRNDVMENGNEYPNYPISVSTKTCNMDIHIRIRF
jgi:hypothetical protein